MAKLIHGMFGLGDNVYQRPVMHGLYESRGTPIHLITPWPELYQDMPFIRCVKPSTTLRTQAASASRWHDWHPMPSGPAQRIGYRISDFTEGRAPHQALARQLNVKLGSFELPWQAQKVPKLAVVRPPTVRDEWHNSARPNDPKYMQQLIDNHPEYDWVAVGWLAPGETTYGVPLRVDHELMHGELSTWEVINLIASAKVLVTCVGFGLPLGIALRTKTLALFGGDVPPELLRTPDMGLSNYADVVPHPFCDCYASRHRSGECNKVLNGVEEAFECLIGAATTATTQ